MSKPEETLALYLRALKLPQPTRECRFHPKRKWRLDFAWPDRKVACEVEGGQHVRGRHNRPEGYEADCEKYSEAALLGWVVIRVTPAMVKSGMAIDLISRALETA